MGIGSMADINKVSGSQIGKSYLNEKTTNTANKFRADTTNAQIDMREKETNLREKDIAEATKQQAIQNIIQSTGQYFSDVQKAKTFNSQMNAMPGTAKQFVDPDQSLGNRLVMGQKSIIKQDPAEMAKYNNSNNEPYWLKDYYNKKSYYNNITE